VHASALADATCISHRNIATPRLTVRRLCEILPGV